MTALDLNHWQNLVYAFWFGFVPAALIASPVMRLLIRTNTRQTISEFVPEHQKKQGTPTMGGIIVVLAGLLCLGLSAFIPGLPGAEYLVLWAGFAAIGFVDDFVVPRVVKGKRGLGWKQKFGLEILVAVIALLLDGGMSPGLVALGVFLILFASNAYNFADGMDGLAASVGILLLGGLVGIAFFVPMKGGLEPSVASILIGALVPFLYLNAPPAKVFMGDVGSLPIGAAIGLIAFRLLFRESSVRLVQAPWPAVLVAMIILSLVLCAELIPVPLQIASVKIRKKRLFLMTPIHHGFEKRGWPETRIVWRFALAQLLCSVLAVTVVAASTAGADHSRSPSGTVHSKP